MTTTIRFDTSAQEGREETGELRGSLLKTKHNARPDFVINEEKGTVTLTSAKTCTEVEEFGHNLEVL
jgi:hypothetical protein